MSLILPTKKAYRETQDWNDPRYRSSYYKFGLLGHNGKDYATPVGTEIVAPHSGKVIESQFDAYGYGWYVKIENGEEGSILAHFKEIPKVGVGKDVKQGDLVGYSGNTGNSTGPHLHWGYYRLPRKRDNGFSGTVDQTHWLNHDCGWEKAIELSATLAGVRSSRDDWKLKCSKLETIVEEFQNKEKIFNDISAQNIKLKKEIDELKHSAGLNLTVSDLFRMLLEKLRPQWQ